MLMTLSLSLLVLPSCLSYKISKIRYYSNEGNYIQVTGTITYIFEDESALYLEFSDMSEKLDDNYFKIVGENYEAIKNFRGIIEVGKTATFMTAPKYFGDGYVMPIVALEIGGRRLLDYETGFPNLVDWMKRH